MSFQTGLQRAGYTNTMTPDLSELIGVNRDVTVTYCSSFSCQSSGTKKRMVSQSVVNKCPSCGSKNHLFYNSLTPTQARRNGIQKKSENIW